MKTNVAILTGDEISIERHSDRPNSIGAYICGNANKSVCGDHIFIAAEHWRDIQELADTLKSMHDAARDMNRNALREDNLIK